MKKIRIKYVDLVQLGRYLIMLAIIFISLLAIKNLYEICT